MKAPKCKICGNDHYGLCGGFLGLRAKQEQEQVKPKAKKTAKKSTARKSPAKRAKAAVSKAAKSVSKAVKNQAAKKAKRGDTVFVGVRLPKALVAGLDKQAKAEGLNRTKVIIQRLGG